MLSAFVNLLTAYLNPSRGPTAHDNLHSLIPLLSKPASSLFYLFCWWTLEKPSFVCSSSFFKTWTLSNGEQQDTFANNFGFSISETSSAHCFREKRYCKHFLSIIVWPRQLLSFFNRTIVAVLLFFPKWEYSGNETLHSVWFWCFVNAFFGKFIDRSLILVASPFRTTHSIIEPPGFSSSLKNLALIYVKEHILFSLPRQYSKIFAEPS